MPSTRDRPLAVYHEHPDWFRPLFAELSRRGVPYVRLDANDHLYEAGRNGGPPAWSLFVNRMSPSPQLEEMERFSSEVIPLVQRSPVAPGRAQAAAPV